MTQPSVNVFEPVNLWPGVAPLAKGDAPADVPQLTLYRPEGAGGPLACVIVCPGGAYRGLAAHEGEPVARWLCEAGVAAAVLRYRVFPYRHPVPLGDAQRAIRLVKRRAGEWGLDAGRIGILGFSAGGHLAASAATIEEPVWTDAADPVDRESCRPDALIACYAVLDFGPKRHSNTRTNLLGDDPDPALVEQLSLHTRVTPRTPPTFLWHTAADKGVPVHNSLLMAAALADNGVPHELHVFPQGGHGLGLAEKQPGANQWPALCVEWLKGIGFSGD